MNALVKLADREMAVETSMEVSNRVERLKKQCKPKPMVHALSVLCFGPNTIVTRPTAIRRPT
ncbi:MAG: hypothetical protein IPO38_10245 [Rhodocyclaceae bacterium]|nr:hypothetical protein [Rhodocyclaceae bacterium]